MSLIPTREDMAFGEGHSQASETYGRMIDHLVKERDAALAEITKLRAERDALQSHNSELRWDQLQPALSRITELEAERDAAVRDMRERCAKVEGVEGDVETATCAFEGGYLVGFNDCHYRFSAAIRALPLAVVATSRATPSEGQS